MIRHYCMGMTGIAVVTGLLTVSCRKEHQRPTDALSGEQQKLSSIISAQEDTGHATLSLSRELLGIISSEPAGDTSGELLTSFAGKLDSAALVLSSSLFMETDPRRIITIVSDYVFTNWGITFNDDRDNIRYLYPHLVLAGKEGSCVGMSLLYLLIAEKTGLPLYGVRAPGHMFVRFDNGRDRCNIETLRNGEIMDNAWYRMRWSITDKNLYPLDNLSTSAVLAVVHYNLGTIFMKQGRNEKALTHLEKATGLLPDFPEAQGNLALTCDALGKSRRALDLLTAVRDAHPSLENIDRNLASLQLKCARYNDALSTYSELTYRNPQDPEFHYGRAVALTQLGRTADAQEALQQVIMLKPGHQGARQLLDHRGK
ncbi:MAG: tetratricopeptide repeat protein [Chitinispirillaceae bacterium]|nr:tetratricopeptide repeat protein [Chitinispirillaceae bacterium]